MHKIMFCVILNFFSTTNLLIPYVKENVQCVSLYLFFDMDRRFLTNVNGLQLFWGDRIELGQRFVSYILLKHLHTVL